MCSGTQQLNQDTNPIVKGLQRKVATLIAVLVDLKFPICSIKDGIIKRERAPKLRFLAQQQQLPLLDFLIQFAKGFPHPAQVPVTAGY